MPGNGDHACDQVGNCYASEDGTDRGGCHFLADINLDREERQAGCKEGPGQLVRHGRGDLHRCPDELVDGGVEVVQFTHLDTETSISGFGKAFDAVFRWDGCVLGLPCTIRGMDSPVDLLP